MNSGRALFGELVPKGPSIGMALSWGVEHTGGVADTFGITTWNGPFLLNRPECRPKVADGPIMEGTPGLVV